MFEFFISDAVAVFVIYAASGFGADEDVANAGKSCGKHAVKCVNSEFDVGEEVFDGANAKQMFCFFLW